MNSTLFKGLLVSIFCVGTSVVAMERQEQHMGLERLSHDVMRKILFVPGQELNIHGLAKAVIALAGTSRALRRDLNTGPNMLELMKSLPTKAAGVYLAEKLGGMSGIQSAEVQEWLSRIRLESGEELYMAVTADNPDLEIVRSIVSNKDIDVNWKNAGWTALMWASLGGHTEIVKVLVAAGANVNLQGSAGMTALRWASGRGHTEVVKVLIASGANVNLQDSDGWTAAMGASVVGYTEVVKALVAAGANVNLRGSTGITALMRASSYGYTEVVKVLVAAGAK